MREERNIECMNLRSQRNQMIQTLYSCRKIEKLLHRDIHFIWLAGYEKPDFITINRFRNRDPCLITLLPDDNLHYVGRLDRDTTGLVILTNDLKLRKRLTLPEFHIPRTYAFTCLNPLKDITPFKEGITIDGDVKCLPAIVEMTSEYEGIITLEEGRYHEIKKMFLSLNNKITSLHRIMYGDISLGDLESGTYRILTQEEINHLKDITRSSI